jgi:hypothetical protein
MKPEIIKCWPHLTGYEPALIPTKGNSKSISNSFIIEMSGLSLIDSTGLAIFISKVYKEYPNIISSNITLNKNGNKYLKNTLEYLGFNSFFKESESLFSTNTSVGQKSTEPLTHYINGFNVTSFPIKCLKFKEQPHRIVIEDFIDELIDKLSPFSEKYKFHLNAFIQLIKEICKNSEDHTDECAFYGMDIYQSDKLTKLTFSFCDLGVGIFQGIKHHMLNSDEYKERASNAALTDAYHFALREGYSTKNNNINKGIGMSIIMKAISQLSLDLNVFDARSRGILNNIQNSISHSEIRKSFYTIGTNAGFHYYGELTLERN